MSTNPAIAASDRKVIVVATSDGQDEFDFDFPIYGTGHVQVYINGTLKTLTTHYSVSGLEVAAGGTVTFTAEVAATILEDDEITILGMVPLTRVSKYAQDGDFRSYTVNVDLDLGVMRDQEQRRDIDVNTAGLAAEILARAAADVVERAQRIAADEALAALLEGGGPAILSRTYYLSTLGVGFVDAMNALTAEIADRGGSAEIVIRDDQTVEKSGQIICNVPSNEKLVINRVSGEISLPSGAAYGALNFRNEAVVDTPLRTGMLVTIDLDVNNSQGTYVVGVASASGITSTGWNIFEHYRSWVRGGGSQIAAGGYNAIGGDAGHSWVSCNAGLIEGGGVFGQPDAAHYGNDTAAEVITAGQRFTVRGHRIMECNLAATHKRNVGPVLYVDGWVEDCVQGLTTQPVNQIDIWDAGTTYADNAQVQLGGVYYQSVQAGNLNHSPPNATWWEVITPIYLSPGQGIITRNMTFRRLQSPAIVTKGLSTLDMEGDHIYDVGFSPNGTRQGSTQKFIQMAGTPGARIVNVRMGYVERVTEAAIGAAASIGLWTEPTVLDAVTYAGGDHFIRGVRMIGGIKRPITESVGAGVSSYEDIRLDAAPANGFINADFNDGSEASFTIKDDKARYFQRGDYAFVKGELKIAVLSTERANLGAIMPAMGEVDIISTTTGAVTVHTLFRGRATASPVGSISDGVVANVQVSTAAGGGTNAGDVTFTFSSDGNCYIDNQSGVDKTFLVKWRY